LFRADQVVEVAPGVAANLKDLSLFGNIPLHDLNQCLASRWRHLGIAVGSVVRIRRSAPILMDLLK
jgi:hypothetical protein